MVLQKPQNSISGFAEEKTIKLDQMPEGVALVSRIYVFALVVPCHSMVFKTFMWKSHESVLTCVYISGPLFE